MNQRRKVLKNLGISVPAVWSATVVQAVLLSAHAQTSPQESTSSTSGTPGTIACSDLVIPGESNSCPASENPGTVRTQYRVDDTGACPVLLESVGTGDPSSPDVLGIARIRNYPLGNNVGYRLATDNATRTTFTATCGEGSTLSGSINESLTFESISGAPWRADFTFTSTASTDTITLSDIVLTPDP